MFSEQSNFIISAELGNWCPGLYFCSQAAKLQHFLKRYTHTTTTSLDDQPSTCSASEDCKGGIKVEVAILR